MERASVTNEKNEASSQRGSWRLLNIFSVNRGKQAVSSLSDFLRSIQEKTLSDWVSDSLDLLQEFGCAAICGVLLFSVAGMLGMGTVVCYGMGCTAAAFGWMLGRKMTASLKTHRAMKNAEKKQEIEREAESKEKIASWSKRLLDECEKSSHIALWVQTQSSEEADQSGARDLCLGYANAIAKVTEESSGLGDQCSSAMHNDFLIELDQHAAYLGQWLMVLWYEGFPQWQELINKMPQELKKYSTIATWMNIEKLAYTPKKTMQKCIEIYEGKGDNAIVTKEEFAIETVANKTEDDLRLGETLKVLMGYNHPVQQQLIKTVLEDIANFLEMRHECFSQKPVQTIIDGLEKKDTGREKYLTDILSKPQCAWRASMYKSICAILRDDNESMQRLQRCESEAATQLLGGVNPAQGVRKSSDEKPSVNEASGNNRDEEGAKQLSHHKQSKKQRKKEKKEQKQQLAVTDNGLFNSNQDRTNGTTQHSPK